jgi:hypothetical protein
MAEAEKKTTESDPRRESGSAEEPGTSLNEDIRARIAQPHKGDVGRAETNEEIYQGSKKRPGDSLKGG